MLATVFFPTTWGGRANSTRGSLEALRKRASIEMEMPGAMAPPRYSPRGETASKVVAVPKSTTMSPRFEPCEGGHRVHHPVGADLARVVVEDGEARLHSGSDEERLHAEVALGHLLEREGQRGHHAGDGDGPHPGRVEPDRGEELPDQDAPLVVGAALRRFDPPLVAERRRPRRLRAPCWCCRRRWREARREGSLTPLLGQRDRRAARRRPRRARGRSPGAHQERAGLVDVLGHPGDLAAVRRRRGPRAPA